MFFAPHGGAYMFFSQMTKSEVGCKVAAVMLACNLLLPTIPASGAVPSKNKSAHKVATSRIDRTGSGQLAILGAKTATTCPLQHTGVKADVSGYVARVSVTQVFQNPTDTKIEALYTFPLPEKAAVDSMTMKVGSRIVRGDIKKREDAKQIYDAAKASGHVASLLDQERTNIFTQSVANIEPGAKVEITINYVDLLPYEAGTYSFAFPTVVGPRFIPGNSTGMKTGVGRIPDTDAVPDASRITPQVAKERAGHDISIDLSINSPVAISDISSKLHEVDVINLSGNRAKISLKDKATIPNKDFVVSWNVATEKLHSGYLANAKDGSGYFTLMVLPPKRVTPAQIAPKELIFLVDCSGSQDGPPLEKAKETLNYIVEHMNANDTFQVISFSDHLKMFPATPQRANADMIKRAKHFVGSLSADGGTWMGPAVEKACAIPPDEHRLRIVTFMTDGYVGNDMEVVGMVKKLRNKSRWFPFGTGNGVNRMLIEAIASEGGGESEYVLLNSPGNVVGKKFYDRISTPVLTDVKMDFHGMPVKEVFPNAISDVWAEKPLYITGRYSAGCAGTVTISGFAGGKPYKEDLAVVFPTDEKANSVLGSIWARKKVDRLMSEDWFGAQQGSVNKELKDEIVKVALDHHIMTQYTSFVAVEEKRVTKDGVTKTIAVPVEMVDGVSRQATLDEEDMGSSSFNSSPVPGGGGAGYGGGFGYANGRVTRTSALRASGPSLPPPPLPASPMQVTKAAPKSSLSVDKIEEQKQQKKESHSDKLDSLLAQLVANPTSSVRGLNVRNGKVSVRIAFKGSLAQMSATLKKLGAVISVSEKNSLIASVDVLALEKIAELDDVVSLAHR